MGRLNALLIGKNGQLGWELQTALAPICNLTAVGRSDLDIADHVALRRFILAKRPDVIVNSAAYTNVNEAPRNVKLAVAINAIAPEIMANAAKVCGAALVHFSTDYVFDGKRTTPYRESDAVNPLNLYGETKLSGERAIEYSGTRYIILRTSWLYSLRGANFVLTIARRAEAGEPLKVVNDQKGSPTWSRHLAILTALLISQESLEKNQKLFEYASGIYHATARGTTSWYGFAKAILREYAKKQVGWSELALQRLEPVSSDAWVSPVIRPSYSVLSNEKLKSTFGLSLPDWKEMLRLALN